MIFFELVLNGFNERDLMKNRKIIEETEEV